MEAKKRQQQPKLQRFRPDWNLPSPIVNAYRAWRTVYRQSRHVKNPLEKQRTDEEMRKRIRKFVEICNDRNIDFHDAIDAIR